MAKLTDVKVLDMQGGKVTRVSYEGAEYVRTEDAAKAGDIVQRRSIYTTHYATGGEYYEAYYNGDMRVYDNESSVIYHAEGWHTFRKQPAATETPDLTQRVDAIDARVSALESAEQDAFTPQHTRPITSYGDLAVGMTLKCVKRCSDFTVGNTYKIVDKDSDGDFEVVSDGGRRKHVTTYRQRGTRTERFEIVSGGYPAPAPPKPTFKVGDYAKVANADYVTLSGFSDGELVKIVENSHGGEADYDYHVERVSDSYSGYAHKEGGYLEPATDAEVAHAKLAAKRAAKFTALGRKVDEYRTGDLVRVVRVTTGHKVGVVGEILHDSVSDYPMVKAFGGEHEGQALFSYVELLAPAEARVDAQ